MIGGRGYACINGHTHTRMHPCMHPYYQPTRMYTCMRACINPPPPLLFILTSTTVDSGRFTFPRSCPGYSPAFQQLIKQCLVPEPAKRPFLPDIMAAARALLL